MLKMMKACPKSGPIHELLINTDNLELAIHDNLLCCRLGPEDLGPGGCAGVIVNTAFCASNVHTCIEVM